MSRPRNYTGRHTRGRSRWWSGRTRPARTAARPEGHARQAPAEAGRAEPPASRVAGPVASPVASRGRRRQLLIGITAGAAALLLVTVTAFVLLSGRGGEAPTAVPGSAPPDAGTPITVVDNWLNGMFVSKNPDAMLRHTCRREADQGKVTEAVASVKAAEREAEDADLSMAVSWSKPREISRAGDDARVASTLEVTVGDKIQKKAADFHLVFETGWKVCDANME